MALQFALGEAAKAAEHYNESPDQPEAGKARQKRIGALRHHHDEHLGEVWALQDPVEKIQVLALVTSLNKSQFNSYFYIVFVSILLFNSMKRLSRSWSSSFFPS